MVDSLNRFQITSNVSEGLQGIPMSNITILGAFVYQHAIVASVYGSFKPSVTNALDGVAVRRAIMLTLILITKTINFVIANSFVISDNGG